MEGTATYFTSMHVPGIGLRAAVPRCCPAVQGKSLGFDADLQLDTWMHVAFETYEAENQAEPL